MALELARAPESTREAAARALRNPAVADGGRRDHIRIVTGPQPFRHAHYAADLFFQVDSPHGAVANVYGQRVLRVTDNFLRTLTAALERESPERADQILHQIGRAWGAATMRDFVARVEMEWEVEFDKLGMSTMLESWWWPLRAAGWGAWRCDVSRARAGLVLIDVFQSATAGAGRRGEFNCSLYAGLFAAVFGHLARRDLGAIELRCAARGDDRCTFLVAGPARIEMAAAHRRDGDSAERIIAALAAASGHGT